MDQYILPKDKNEKFLGNKSNSDFFNRKHAEHSQDSQVSVKRSIFTAVKIDRLFFLMVSGAMADNQLQLTDSHKKRGFADNTMCLPLQPEEYHDHFQHVVNILSSLPKEYVEEQIGRSKDSLKKQNKQLLKYCKTISQDETNTRIQQKNQQEMIKLIKQFCLVLQENRHLLDYVSKNDDPDQKQDHANIADPENKIFLGELLTLAALGMFTIVFCLSALYGRPIEQYEPERDWQGSGI